MVFQKAPAGYCSHVMKRLILGFGIAAVVGGGAGAAIGPIAKSMATPRAAPSSLTEIDVGRVQIESVKGKVQALNAKGDWISVDSKARVHRPVRIRTVGWDSQATLSFKGVRLVVEQNADLMLSAPGPSPSILVQAGHVRLHRGTGDIAMYIPDREVKLIGQTYGVWVRDERVAVAVLEGELEVKAGGHKAMKFANRRELVLVDRVVPALLDERLQIQVKGTSRRGYRYTLTGRTAPHALVVHVDDKGKRNILKVSSAGVFSVDLLDRRPQPGQLVAYDSAGRRAEVDSPSASLKEIVASLSGVALAVDDAIPPATEAKAPATPAPAKPAAIAPPVRAKKPTKKVRPKPEKTKQATRGAALPASVKLEMAGAKKPPLADAKRKVEVDPASGAKRPTLKKAAAPAAVRTKKPKPSIPAEEAL